MLILPICGQIFHWILIKVFKNWGYKIIFEGVNTPAVNIKNILDAEYAALKLLANHGITQETIDDELERLAISDYIYSCSATIR